VTDAPSLEFNGLKLYVVRDARQAGSIRVTGRVEFPCLVGEDLDTAARKIRHGERITGRKECPIDYTVSDEATERRSDEGEQTHLNPSNSSHLSQTAARRVEVVAKWRAECTAHRDQTKADVAKRVLDASGMKCSVRTLQLWAQKFDLHGPAALTPGYSVPRSLLPAPSATMRRDALLLCAWWSFRIGNVATIDTKMLAAAVEALRYGLADLIATVDCYYAWDTDRSRYMFKLFSKWVRYDLKRWYLRAAANEDYRRTVRAGSRERVPLHTVDRTANTALVHGPATRKRRALDPRTRRDIVALSEPEAQALGPPPLPGKGEGRGDGLGEFLIALPEDLGGMLLRAAGPDHRDGVSAARGEAVATLVLWWERLPEPVRERIDACIESWRVGRPNITDEAADKRRILMLLPELRDPDLLRSVRVASRMAL